MKNCVQCHAPAHTANGKTMGGVRHDCTECHRYHNGDKPWQGLGAKARDPLVPGNVEQFMPPESINVLDDALNVELVSHVTGSMEDLYGDQFAIDFVFDWAPWVEKLTGAKRRAYQEPSAGRFAGYC